VKRWPEVAIAALVVAVVVMLIVPVPRPLLDGLLTLNIGIAVALLMAALFTSRPMSFQSFPTLLVVTTLFRVGLEVSTTRLVLADADAGSVVRAFGTSVVAANLVVGLVVFAVITIVQLIVVARGSERVAEVAARFALDAMPGKQMAIDAELRAGTIDPDTARTRRGDLERESQLYGAMDGAMRFVKGDAIAAIVIVVVNLVGGLIIGVGSRGMTAAQAVRTYSLLSVGAGLVAQIPSLLVAVASGMLVTRVASTGDAALGADLGRQLSPRVLAAVAILLIGLALVPGLPLAPFFVLGAVAAVAAVLSARVRPRDISAEELQRRTRARVQITAPSPRTVSEPQVIAEVQRRTGFALPAVLITEGPELVISIDGTPVAWPATVEEVPGAVAALVPDLLGLDAVGELVQKTAAHAPVLVREVVPRIVTLPALTEIVRQLAREQVPVDDLAGVLEAIALAPPTKETSALVEHVRGHLRRQISARWAPRGQLAVYTVDGMIEDAVRSAIDRRDGAPVLALEPAIAQDIVAAVRGKLKSGVILVSGDIRRHLRTLLEPELPDVAVLAAHELAPGTAVTTAGRIDVA
jgi:type III secretion protein V